MKIIVIDNLTDIAVKGSAPRITLGADSALLRHNEPLFVDEDYRMRQSVIAPAVRIGRLGTHIPLKFAEKYIDAHTLFHLYMPPPGMDRSLWGASDRSFSPGLWLDGNIKAENTVDVCRRKLDQDCLESGTFTLDIDPGHVAAAVAAISNYATLKTGDVFVFTNPALSSEIDRNLQLGVSINSMNVLDFRIK